MPALGVKCCLSEPVSVRLMQFVRTSPLPGETSLCYPIGVPAIVRLHVYDRLGVSDLQTSFLKKGEGRDKETL